MTGSHEGKFGIAASEPMAEKGPQRRAAELEFPTPPWVPEALQAFVLPDVEKIQCHRLTGFIGFQIHMEH